MTIDPKTTSVYQDAAQAANDAYQNALNSIKTQRDLTDQEYGTGAYANNPYGLFEQSAHNYANTVKEQQIAHDIFVRDSGRGTAQLTLNQQRLLDSLGLSRSNLQRDSGLTDTFDANGNPIGHLTLDAGNTHSQFQDLLRSEASNMQGAENSSIARGLGFGKGLARQAASTLRFNQAGEQQNFRTNLLDQLVGLGRQQTQGTQDFNTAMTANKNSIADMLHKMQRDADQAKWQQGADQYGLARSRDLAMAGYTSSAAQAEADYRAQLNSAMLNSIMMLANGDPGIGGTPLPGPAQGGGPVDPNAPPGSPGAQSLSDVKHDLGYGTTQPWTSGL